MHTHKELRAVCTHRVPTQEGYDLMLYQYLLAMYLCDPLTLLPVPKGTVHIS